MILLAWGSKTGKLIESEWNVGLQRLTEKQGAANQQIENLNETKGIGFRNVLHGTMPIDSKTTVWSYIMGANKKLDHVLNNLFTTLKRK